MEKVEILLLMAFMVLYLFVSIYFILHDKEKDKKKIKMKTFKDLEFKLRDDGVSQAFMYFPNGYGVSVLFGGPYAYSNGKNTYELAVLKGTSICYDTPVTDDVLSYITEDEVTEAMETLQNLRKDE